MLSAASGVSAGPGGELTLGAGTAPVGGVGGGAVVTSPTLGVTPTSPDGPASPDLGPVNLPGFTAPADGGSILRGAVGSQAPAGPAGGDPLQAALLLVPPRASGEIAPAPASAATPAQGAGDGALPDLFAPERPFGVR
jgi:hypothetical protein